MSMRRFTRLTSGFSKKVGNLTHAVSLFYCCNASVRIHQTLRVRPAMAAGVTDRLWELEDIVRLADERQGRGRETDRPTGMHWCRQHLPAILA